MSLEELEKKIMKIYVFFFYDFSVGFFWLLCNFGSGRRVEGGRRVVVDAI
jgi:hypothetical protein